MSGDHWLSVGRGTEKVVIKDFYKLTSLTGEKSMHPCSPFLTTSQLGLLYHIHDAASPSRVQVWSFTVIA